MVEKFDQKDTKAVKGIAIVLMLLHHIAGFKDRAPVNFEGFKSVIWKGFVEGDVIYNVALASKICVAIFMFLGGYGMYKKYIKGNYSLYENVIGLYKKFWLVFIIFIPLGYIFFRHEPSPDINSLCTHFIINSRKDFVNELVANFLGLSWSLNGEWWFFPTYIVTLFWGVIFCSIRFKRKDFYRECLFVFIIDVMLRKILPGIGGMELFNYAHNSLYFSKLLTLSTYSCSFFLGIVFAKYDALVRLKKRISDNPLKIPVCIIGLTIILISRTYLRGEDAELLYVPFLTVFASVLFDNMKRIKKVFVFLGEQSTYMWLVHSFYCYYFYDFTLIVYRTRNVFVDLFVLVFISACTSIILEYISNSAEKFLGNLKNNKKAKTSKDPDAAEETESSGSSEQDKQTEIAEESEQNVPV